MQEDCTHSETKKYCCVTDPCQQDDIFWAELPKCSVGRLCTWEDGGEAVSCLGFGSVVCQSCISSPGQFVPFLQRTFMLLQSFYPQQSLAQAVPLLPHPLNKKEVAHPTAYMLLTRKSCHSSLAIYLSPGRTRSGFSCHRPHRQHTPALLSFSKYSVPKLSEI